MNGNGTRSQGAGMDPSVAPVEQLSNINEGTIRSLIEAKAGLDVLSVKVHGSKPPDKQDGQAPQSQQCRCLVSDAFVIRGLAFEISQLIAELHCVIGHD